MSFITNNQIKKEINNFTYNETGNIFTDLFNNIEKYLFEILKKNNLKLENVYKNHIIINHKYKGIFIHQSNNEKELCQIYKYLTNNIPVKQNILICNKETTNDELTAFLFRALLCEFNSCFILSEIELLDNNQKKILIDLLFEFDKEYEKIKSCLIILYKYSNYYYDIYKALNTFQKIKILEIHKKDIEDITFEQENIIVISSDKAGIGKSKLIETEIKSNNQNYIYFPLGDKLNKNNIIKRLKELNIENNTVIHLDLYDTENISLMKEFLFSILILKSYGENENFVYLPKDINIKIEIQNGKMDFIELFPILTLFPSKKLYISNLPPLIISKEIDSNVQIVANYLKLIKNKQIDEKELYIENISHKNILSYENKILAESLEQKECEELIINEIRKDIEMPNFYQIASFINFLATILIKFNRNKNLYNNKILSLEIDNLNNIKSFIINSAIKIAKILINTENNEVIIENENIIKENNNANKFDESFNKLFMVLINLLKDDIDYEELIKLKNSIEKNEENNILSKYNNYDKFGFLKELKYILNMTNPIKKSENDEQNSLEEIFKDFIFTYEIFIKIIIIYLKIQANIPIILIGEVGCGKTTLIKKIADLMNEFMFEEIKILNIHSGIIENNIIPFFENNVVKNDKTLIENNYKNKLYNPKKLIFLENINTCNYLGLISELINKNSYLGKGLPQNIYFIASYNTLRKKTNNDIHNRNLPYSLNNYLLNFYNLFEKNEIKFIEQITFEKLKKIFNENKENLKEEDFIKIHNFSKEMIIASNNYIKESIDISISPMNKINIFNILYVFFFYYLKEKKTQNQDYNELSLHIYSINLSIFICYYLYLDNKILRKKLNEIYNKILNNFDEEYREEDFLDIPKKEALFIANNIQLPKNIIKTDNLIYNLFSLFVAINTQIPIFLTGKTGCGKTLSVELIIKSMKGNSSNSLFFKKFPKLFSNTINCFTYDFTQEIENCFNKAKNIFEKLDEVELRNSISLIIFDNMNFEDNNLYNIPLELEKNLYKISFIGLSNKRINSSLLNIGIHISIPNNDENDFTDIALKIGNYYDKNMVWIFKSFFINLSNIYNEYKKYLNKNDYVNEDFHGILDYFYFIKNISKNILEKYKNFQIGENTIEKILFSSVAQNLNGLEFHKNNENLNSLDIIINFIIKNMNSNLKIDNDYFLLDKIKDNISDLKSRYIMLISKTSSTNYLLSSLLSSMNKNFIFCVGSPFIKDIQSKYYLIKIFDKIQSYLEKGKI